MHVLIFVMFSDVGILNLIIQLLCLHACFTYLLFLKFHYLYHLVSSCGIICSGKSEMYLKVFERNYNYN